MVRRVRGGTGPRSGNPGEGRGLGDPDQGRIHQSFPVETPLAVEADRPVGLGPPIAQIELSANRLGCSGSEAGRGDRDEDDEECEAEKTAKKDRPEVTTRPGGARAAEAVGEMNLYWKDE